MIFQVGDRQQSLGSAEEEEERFQSTKNVLVV